MGISKDHDALSPLLTVPSKGEATNLYIHKNSFNNLALIFL